RVCETALGARTATVGVTPERIATWRVWTTIQLARLPSACRVAGFQRNKCTMARLSVAHRKRDFSNYFCHPPKKWLGVFPVETSISLQKRREDVKLCQRDGNRFHHLSSGRMI